MRVLGVDVGERRVGLAVSDATGTIATPLETLVRLNPDRKAFIYDSGNTCADSLPLVAQAYRRHLLVITRLIHSKASLAVREFSRAFEFKRDS
jgi:hypothetical protein